jgi:transcriptional regulator with XRE-family HTH domain
MTTDGVRFGNRLKEARERNGVGLEAVSETTKIKLSLLAGLERGDVSGWPRGIFRRAFIREYAGAIGLQPSSVLAEFSKLFPDDGDSRIVPADARDIDTGLRLTLAVDDGRISRATIRRFAAALLDLLGVVSFGAGAAYLTGGSIRVSAGIAALVYYTIATAWFGRSAAAWWLDTRSRESGRMPPPAAAVRAAGPDRLQIVSRRHGPSRPRSIEPGAEHTSDVPSAIAAGR